MTSQCPVCEKPNADTTTVRTVDLSGGKPTVKDQDVCIDCAAELIAQHITPACAGRKDRTMMTSEQILQEAVEKAAGVAKAGISTSIDALKRDLEDDRQALFADRNNLSDALLEVIKISVEPKMRAHRLELIRQCAGSALDRSNGVARQQVEALK